MATAAECRDRLEELVLPLLLLHGDSDRLTSVHSSQLTFETARSTDKTLKIFKGLYHETMNETPAERQKVLEILNNWILEKCIGSLQASS